MYRWNAEDYAKHSAGQARWAHELLDDLQLKPNDVVLDVGCGDGKITATIAERVPQGRVIGIDLSADMVRYTREKYGAQYGSRLQAMQMDAAAISFDAQFTVVFSNATLHWVRNHQRVLAAVSQALLPRGRFVAQMGGHGNSGTMIAAFEAVMQRPQWRKLFQGFVSSYTFHHPDDYRIWLAQADLQAEEVVLIPKDMVHATSADLAGWLRTAWHPYVSPVPQERRDEFIDATVANYLTNSPPDSDGKIHVPMVRLQVRAFKKA